MNNPGKRGTEEARKKGIKSGNEAFAQFIDPYFDSRYIPDLLPALYNYSLEMCGTLLLDDQVFSACNLIAQHRGNLEPEEIPN